MQMSKSSLLQDASRRNASLDPISHIYSIIRDEALRTRAGSSTVSYADALNWVTRKVRKRTQGHLPLELVPLSYLV